jgi:hypothetical protein
MHLCIIRTITKLNNMKKITLLLFLFTAWTGFSQQTVLEDFDGSAPNTADENGTTNVVIEGIAGGAPESAGGGNNSLKIITSASGQPWQGAAVVTQDPDAPGYPEKDTLFPFGFGLNYTLKNLTNSDRKD